MLATTENIPLIPKARSLGLEKAIEKGHEWKPSRSSRIVGMLQSLSKDHCITLLPEYAYRDEKSDLERQRVLWYNAAKRAGIAIVSRLVTTQTGDRAIRIWRTDYP